jgi:hypothetical protein
MKKIQLIPKVLQQAKHARPQNEILEELVTSVRSLDSRLREVTEEAPRGLRRRWRNLHPMMFHELTHMLGGRKDDPIALLVLASFVRDDMPWMYELAMEAYRIAKTGSPEEASAARRRLRRAAKLMRDGPFAPEEMGMDPRMLHMMVRELDHVLGPASESDVEPNPALEPPDRSPSKVKRKKT